MKIGTGISYADKGFGETVDRLVELEKAGLDLVNMPEAYSFDAVSQLGFIAARTERLELCSAILQIYTRTPSLTAMTAAGLDYVSGGRFTLGIGASGPQVIEGFHGVRYDAPLGRTREIIEICRQVWRRERVNYDGKYYTIPLPKDQGTGLGKPLKLINHPVRERIPIQLAAIGPKNVALAAELAEIWEPLFFDPDRADAVWGESLAAGRELRDPDLPPLQIAVPVACAVGRGAGGLLDRVRPTLALYIGGMGARGQNFYTKLAGRYGYAEEAARIQDLYLGGDKPAAEAAVPVELIDAVSLVGTEDEVAAKLRKLHDTGVTGIAVEFLEGGHEAQVRTIETLRSLLPT
jgi:F420-dependent oxidoreductase-like protein